MQQTFDEPIASAITQTQPGNGIERVTLLRGASAIAAANFRDAFGAAMLGHTASGLELLVERAAQPEIEDLIAHREQRLIARAISDVGES